MRRVLNRVKEDCSVTGYGAIQLSGASLGGFKPFSSGLAHNDYCYYAVESGVNFEGGVGQYDATLDQINRISVIVSSAAGDSIVSFTAEAGQVCFSAPPAQFFAPNVTETSPLYVVAIDKNTQNYPLGASTKDGDYAAPFAGGLFIADDSYGGMSYSLVNRANVMLNNSVAKKAWFQKPGVYHTDAVLTTGVERPSTVAGRFVAVDEWIEVGAVKMYGSSTTGNTFFADSTGDVYLNSTLLSTSVGLDLVAGPHAYLGDGSLYSEGVGFILSSGGISNAPVRSASVHPTQNIYVDNVHQLGVAANSGLIQTSSYLYPGVSSFSDYSSAVSSGRVWGHDRAQLRSSPALLSAFNPFSFLIDAEHTALFPLVSATTLAMACGGISSTGGCFVWGFSSVGVDYYAVKFLRSNGEWYDLSIPKLTISSTAGVTIKGVAEVGADAYALCGMTWEAYPYIAVFDLIDGAPVMTHYVEYPSVAATVVAMNHDGLGKFSVTFDYGTYLRVVFFEPGAVGDSDLITI